MLDDEEIWPVDIETGVKDREPASGSLEKDFLSARKEQSPAEEEDHAPAVPAAVPGLHIQEVKVLHPAVILSMLLMLVLAGVCASMTLDMHGDLQLARAELVEASDFYRRDSGWAATAMVFGKENLAKIRDLEKRATQMEDLTLSSRLDTLSARLDTLSSALSSRLDTFEALRKLRTKDLKYAKDVNHAVSWAKYSEAKAIRWTKYLAKRKLEKGY